MSENGAIEGLERSMSGTTVLRRFLSGTRLYWIAIAAAFAPMLILHSLGRWADEQNQYFPALILAIGYLFATQWDRVLRNPDGKIARWGIRIGLWVCLPISILLFSPWLSALGWVIVLGGFLASQHQKIPPFEEAKGLSRSKSKYVEVPIAPNMLALWPLTWLILPLPLNLDRNLTASLQLISSRLSSYVLDMLAVSHLMVGNVMELKTGRLFVEEACSGIQSLNTLVFCSFVLVVGFRRKLILLPVYVAAAAFWSLLMNMLRIVSIAWVLNAYNADWSHGWKHDLLGYACLGLAVLLLVSTDTLLRIFFFPSKPDSNLQSPQNPFIELWNSLFWLSTEIKTKYHERKSHSLDAISSPPTDMRRVLIFAVVVVAVQAIFVTGDFVRARFHSQEAYDETPIFQVTQFTKDEIQKHILGGTYEQTTGRIDLPMGRNADIWRSSIDGLPIAVVISQPYPEWHELTSCYSGIGWDLNQSEILSTAAKDWKYVKAHFVSENKQYQYLYIWYSAMDEDGSPITPPSNSILDRITQTFTVRLGTSNWFSKPRAAMIQLTVESENILPAKVLEQFEELHLETRSSFQECLNDRAQNSATSDLALFPSQ